MSVLLDDRKNNHLTPNYNSHVLDVNSIVGRSRSSNYKFGSSLSVMACTPMINTLSPTKPPLIANINRIATKNKELSDIFFHSNPKDQHNNQMKEIPILVSP
jgi:hypothetical protein